MKTVFRIIIFLAVILGILFVGRNIIVKFAVEKGVEAATGLPLKIKKLNLGLAKTHIDIQDLKLFSPEGFNNEVMFYAPEIFVDYNLGAIIKGKIHLEDIRLNFDQVVIVTNKQGKTNLEALKPKVKTTQPAKETEKKKDVGVKKAPKIQIDHLMIKIGKGVYKNYSKEGEPLIKELAINISQEMNDATNVQRSVDVIIKEILKKTALNALMNNIAPDVDPEKTMGVLNSLTESLKK